MGTPGVEMASCSWLGTVCSRRSLPCFAPLPHTSPPLPPPTRRYTASRSDSGGHHASVLAAAASIMREEGPSGYYRGLRTKVDGAGGWPPCLEAWGGHVAAFFRWGSSPWQAAFTLSFTVTQALNRHHHSCVLLAGAVQVVQSVLAAALLFVAKEEITSEQGVGVGVRRARASLTA